MLHVTLRLDFGIIGILEFRIDIWLGLFGFTTMRDSWLALAHYLGIILH